MFGQFQMQLLIKLKIRVSRGNTISESNDVFTIVDVPTNLSISWPCPDSIYVSWNSVSGFIL